MNTNIEDDAAIKVAQKVAQSVEASEFDLKEKAVRAISSALGIMYSEAEKTLDRLVRNKALEPYSKVVPNDMGENPNVRIGRALFSYREPETN